MSMTRLVAAVLVGAAATLSGCAVAPSTPAALTAETPAVAKPHAASVSVTTAPSTAGRGVVSDAAITDAIVASIEKTKAFSRVVKGAGADYQLTAVLISTDLPAFAATFTCKAEMAWSLKRADGTAVWQEVIKSEGTSSAGEAFAGAERAKRSIERSIRDNIGQALTKIGALSL